MAAFTIDLDQLDTVIGQLGEYETILEQRLAELDARVAALQSRWTGSAADAQQEAHQEWMAGAQQMREALVGLRSAAAIAHENYASAVAANSQMWG